eukprot:4084371-Alexandrium_andersonii.AAC.1
MAGQEQAPCEWCGECTQDHKHLFWCCGKFDSVREQYNANIGMQHVELLPPVLLRCGVAPRIRLPAEGHHSTFLGASLNQPGP